MPGAACKANRWLGWVPLSEFRIATIELHRMGRSSWLRQSESRESFRSCPEPSQFDRLSWFACPCLKPNRWLRGRVRQQPRHEAQEWPDRGRVGIRNRMIGEGESKTGWIISRAEVVRDFRSYSG